MNVAAISDGTIGAGFSFGTRIETDGFGCPLILLSTLVVARCAA
jgi:hypothetical protein